VLSEVNVQPVDRGLVVERHTHLAVLRLVRRAEPIGIEDSESSRRRWRDFERIGDLAAKEQLTRERANVADTQIMIVNAEPSVQPHQLFRLGSGWAAHAITT
jgi:hypothetical protein